jgi:hypothetical protein
VRLATALGLFWEVRGHFSEGRERLSAVLATEASQGHTLGRAQLLARAGELAYRQSDYPATISFAEESLEICRSLGDQQGVASALIKLGNAATEALKELEEWMVGLDYRDAHDLAIGRQSRVRAGKRDLLPAVPGEQAANAFALSLLVSRVMARSAKPPLGSARIARASPPP